MSSEPTWHFSSIEKVADKLNDFLMNPKSRPDLQSPQAQLKYRHNLIPRDVPHVSSKTSTPGLPEAYSDNFVTARGEPVPEVLHHWTEARNLPDWKGQNAIMPHGIYLTQNHDVQDWNPDVPYMEHPVRLDIDTSKLDPEQFGYDEQTGEGYQGRPDQSWGNFYYKGTIPQEALRGHKVFRAPDHWHSWSF